MVECLLLLVALRRAAVRARTDLVAENVLLRQQLGILSRPTRTRPRLRRRDRLFWRVVRLARRDWRRHLVLVRPETVVRWHRRGWRLFPVATAKEVATLDVVSGGRVELGVGVGWLREEFEAPGHGYFGRRGAVADEQIAADVRAYRAVGVDRFVLSFGGNSPDQIEQAVRRFAEEVRPQVRSLP